MPFMANSQRSRVRVLLIVIALAFITAMLAIPYLVRGPRIRQVRYSSTWQGSTGGLIKSTDPAGIAYHAPSGHLFLVDSEIDEISQWHGVNVFELSLDLAQMFGSYDTVTDPREPTGVTYNAFDGYFYVTNDATHRIYRFGNGFGEPIASVNTLGDVRNARDPEGITSDPATGFLYVADGNGGGRQILAYDINLEYRGRFYVGDVLDDPEGIAYEPVSHHLFVVSSTNIAEYTLDGMLVNVFSISGFYPPPIAPQGLVFAPSSDPYDEPTALSLYIVDGMTDNFPDGRIYEAMIMK